MSELIIIAIISLVGTVGGSLIGVLAANKLTTYRIGELEKKVDKHNNVIERMYVIEKDMELVKKDVYINKEDIKSIEDEIT